MTRPARVERTAQGLMFLLFLLFLSLIGLEPAVAQPSASNSPRPFVSSASLPIAGKVLAQVFDRPPGSSDGDGQELLAALLVAKLDLGLAVVKCSLLNYILCGDATKALNLTARAGADNPSTATLSSGNQYSFGFLNAATGYAFFSSVVGQGQDQPVLSVIRPLFSGGIDGSMTLMSTAASFDTDTQGGAITAGCVHPSLKIAYLGGRTGRIYWSDYSASDGTHTTTRVVFSGGSTPNAPTMGMAFRATSLGSAGGILYAAFQGSGPLMTFVVSGSAGTTIGNPNGLGPSLPGAALAYIPFVADTRLFAFDSNTLFSYGLTAADGVGAANQPVTSVWNAESGTIGVRPNYLAVGISPSSSASAGLWTVGCAVSGTTVNVFCALSTNNGTTLGQSSKKGFSNAGVCSGLTLVRAVPSTTEFAVAVITSESLQTSATIRMLTVESLSDFAGLQPTPSPSPSPSLTPSISSSASLSPTSSSSLSATGSISGSETASPSLSSSISISGSSSPSLSASISGSPLPVITPANPNPATPAPLSPAITLPLTGKIVGILYSRDAMVEVSGSLTPPEQPNVLAAVFVQRYAGGSTVYKCDVDALECAIESPLDLGSLELVPSPPSSLAIESTAAFYNPSTGAAFFTCIVANTLDPLIVPFYPSFLHLADEMPSASNNPISFDPGAGGIVIGTLHPFRMVSFFSSTLGRLYLCDYSGASGSLEGSGMNVTRLSGDVSISGGAAAGALAFRPDISTTTTEGTGTSSTGSGTSSGPVNGILFAVFEGSETRVYSVKITNGEIVPEASAFKDREVFPSRISLVYSPGLDGLFIFQGGKMSYFQYSPFIASAALPNNGIMVPWGTAEGVVSSTASPLLYGDSNVFSVACGNDGTAQTINVFRDKLPTNFVEPAVVQAQIPAAASGVAGVLVCSSLTVVRTNLSWPNFDAIVGVSASNARSSPMFYRLSVDTLTAVGGSSGGPAAATSTGPTAAPFPTETTVTTLPPFPTETKTGPTTNPSTDDSSATFTATMSISPSLSVSAEISSSLSLSQSVSGSLSTSASASASVSASPSPSPPAAPPASPLPLPSAIAAASPASTLSPLPSPLVGEVLTVPASTFPKGVTAALLSLKPLPVRLQSPICETGASQGNMSTSTSNGDAAAVPNSLVIAEGFWPSASLLLRLGVSSVLFAPATAAPAMDASLASSKWLLTAFQSIADGKAGSAKVSCYASSSSAAGAVVKSRLLISSVDLVEPLEVVDGSVVATFAVNVTATLRSSSNAALPWTEAEGVACSYSSPTVVAPSGVPSSAALGALQSAGLADKTSALSASFFLASNVKAFVWSGVWPVPSEWRIADLFGTGLKDPCADSLSSSLLNSRTTTSHCFASAEWFQRLLAVSQSLGDMTEGAISLSGSTVIIATRAPDLAPFPFVGGPVANGSTPFAGLEIFFGGARVSAIAALPERVTSDNSSSSILASAIGKSSTIAFLSPPYEAVCPDVAATPQPAQNASGSSGPSSSSSSSSGGGGGGVVLVRSTKVCPPPRLVIRIPSSSSAYYRQGRDAAKASLCAAAGYTPSLSSSPSSSPGSLSALELRRPGVAACPPACSWSALPPSIIHEEQEAVTISSAGGQAARRLAATTPSQQASLAAAFEELSSLAGTGVADAEAPLSSKALLPLSAVMSGIGGASSGGFIYTRPCVEKSKIPAGVVSLTSICANFSNPLSRPQAGLCLYGEPPENCLTCPSGGICPGGYRLWSAPSFFVPSEDSIYYPTPCSFPAAQRCVGWSNELGTTQCGEGYLQGSYACGFCAKGYYSNQRTNGACEKCPANDGSISAFIVPILIVFGAILAVASVLGVVTVIITLKAGGTVIGGLMRLVAFVMSVFQAVMVVSNMSKAAPSNSPQFVSTVFSAFRAIQGEDVGPVPIACTDLSPFIIPQVLMGLGLTCFFLWLIGFAVWYSRLSSSLSPQSDSSATTGAFVVIKLLQRVRAACGRLDHWLVQLASRGFLTASVLLFAVVANAALNQAACVQTEVNLQEYRSMTQDGTAAAAALGISYEEQQTTKDQQLLSQVFSVYVLANQQDLVCFEGQHLPTYRLAITTIAFYVLGFPLLAFLLMRFLAIPVVLRTTKIPTLLLKQADLPHVSFAGTFRQTVQAQLQGAIDGAAKAAKQAKKAHAERLKKAKKEAKKKGKEISKDEEQQASAQAGTPTSEEEAKAAEAAKKAAEAALEKSELTEWALLGIMSALDKRRQAMWMNGVLSRKSATQAQHGQRRDSMASGKMGGWRATARSSVFFGNNAMASPLQAKRNPLASPGTPGGAGVAKEASPDDLPPIDGAPTCPRSFAAKVFGLGKRFQPADRTLRSSVVFSFPSTLVTFLPRIDASYTGGPVLRQRALESLVGENGGNSGSNSANATPRATKNPMAAFTPRAPPSIVAVAISPPSPAPADTNPLNHNRGRAPRQSRASVKLQALADGGLVKLRIEDSDSEEEEEQQGGEQQEDSDAKSADKTGGDVVPFVPAATDTKGGPETDEVPAEKRPSLRSSAKTELITIGGEGTPGLQRIGAGLEFVSADVELAPCGCACCGGRCGTRVFSRRTKTAEDVIDSSLSLSTQHQTIFFFTGGAEYRASCFFFIILNMMLIALTQVGTVFIPNATARPLFLLVRGAILFTASLLFALANLLVLPDAAGKSWLLMVRCFVLVLSAFGSLYNSLGAASTSVYESDNESEAAVDASIVASLTGNQSGLDFLAYLVSAMSIALPFLIVFSFVSTLSTGAVQEKKAEKVQAKATKTTEESNKRFIAAQEVRLAQAKAVEAQAKLQIAGTPEEREEAALEASVAAALVAETVADAATVGVSVPALDTSTSSAASNSLQLASPAPTAAATLAAFRLKPPTDFRSPRKVVALAPSKVKGGDGDDDYNSDDSNGGETFSGGVQRLKSPRKVSMMAQKDRLSKIDAADEASAAKAQLSRLYVVSRTRASMVRVKRKSEGPASFAGSVARPSVAGGNAMLPLHVLEELRAEEEAEAAAAAALAGSKDNDAADDGEWKE